MNFLEIYINSLPVKTPLKFGVNKGIVLNNIDISDRLTKKGDPSPKSFFMEFFKLDEDNEVCARSEYSFFKFNADKLDLVEMNFNSQFNKLLTLALVLFDDDEALDARMDEVNAEMFKENISITEKADDIFKYNSKTLAKKKPKLRELKVMVEELNNDLNLFFYKVMQGKYGKDISPVMELLSVVDKKGYTQLPDEDIFVSLEEDILSVEAKYIRRKSESEKPDKPDTTGDSFSEDNLDALDEIADNLLDEPGGDLGELDINELSDIADI